MDPMDEKKAQGRDRRSVPPRPAWSKLFRRQDVPGDDEVARSRSASLPSVMPPPLNVERIQAPPLPPLPPLRRRDAWEECTSTDTSTEMSHRDTRQKHAFAPAIAGHYTVHHRPVGLKGLQQLDSTTDVSDDEHESESLWSGRRGEKGSTAQSFSVDGDDSVYELDSPRSEEFEVPTADRYGFVSGFGQPIGILSLYNRPVLK